MAEDELAARLFDSGIIESVVACVQRAQASDVSPHASPHRSIEQMLVGVSTTAEGRAKLLATAGIEDALMWLLQHGGDPAGIAANGTLANPRGMAGEKSHAIFSASVLSVRTECPGLLQGFAWRCFAGGRKTRSLRSARRSCARSSR